MFNGARNLKVILLSTSLLLPIVSGMAMGQGVPLPEQGQMQATGTRTSPNSAKSATALPPDCDKPALLSKGRPIMAPERKDLAFGVSLEKHSYPAGKPVVLHIWVDNSSDSRIGVWTCMDLGYFKSRGFDLYDVHGHRVLRRYEVKVLQKCGVNPRVAQMMMQRKCLRNFMLFIPAHSCVTGDSFDYTTDLTSSYDLAPGKYTLRFRHWKFRNTDVCEKLQEPDDKNDSGPELTFTVLQP